MMGLPKIVRQRLGQALGGRGSVNHPDANLLASLVEHSLTPSERSRVLGHLAECGQCRQQVSLALPNVENPVATAGIVVRHRWRAWLRWPVLRWGLLVASLMIMGTVALVRQPRARHRLRQPAAPVVEPSLRGALPSDVTIGAAPSKARKGAGQPPQEIASLKALSQDRLTTRQFALEAQQEPAAAGKGKSANAQLAAPVPEALRSSPLASKQASSEAPVGRGDAKGQSMNETRAAAVPVAPAPKLMPQPAVAPEASQAKPAPVVSAAGHSANLAIDWSVSPSGRVQRSLDGRKTWEEVDVDKDVVFRVVFAVGPNVWLGGTKGALYHSTDGGQHWERIKLTSDSFTSTDTVTTISFSDSQHGTVKTKGGKAWVTSDGGQHWQEQR